MKHTICRLCENPLPAPFLSLGDQPLANNLLDAPNDPYAIFPLELVKCGACHLVQLTEVVPPDLLFKHYLYTPSQSATFRNHFQEMANTLAYPLEKDDLVVDIGSNDGLLLSYFKELGMRVVGVEPAENLAREANARGITTIPAFFSAKVADEIIKHHGSPKLVTATNVFAHVDKLKEFTAAVADLLPTGGAFVIEVPHLPQMLQDGTIDLVYHEHLSCWTLHTLRAFFIKCGMRVFDAQMVPVHGGSVRVYADHGERQPTDGYLKLLLAEQIGEQAYTNLAGKAQDVRYHLTTMVKNRRRGEIIAGYTAPAKATVLLNFCGLTSSDITYVVDDSSLKQGKFIPGTGIPVVNSIYMEENHPDSVIIFAWNLSADIMPKLARIARDAIIPFPEVRRLPILLDNQQN